MPGIEEMMKDPEFLALPKAEQEDLIKQAMQKSAGTNQSIPLQQAPDVQRASSARVPVDRFGQPLPTRNWENVPRTDMEPGLQDVPLFLPIAPGAQQAVLRSPVTLPLILAAGGVNPLTLPIAGEMLRQTLLPQQETPAQPGSVPGLTSFAQRFGEAVQQPGVLPATAMGGAMPFLPQGAGYSPAIRRTLGGATAGTAGEMARRGFTDEPIAVDHMLSDWTVNALVQAVPELGLQVAGQVLKATPPAQKYVSTQKRQELQGQIDELQQNLQQAQEGAAQRISGYQTEMDRLLGEGHQQQWNLKEALEHYGKSAKTDIATMRQASRNVSEGYGTTKEALLQLHDDARRQIELQKLVKGSTPSDVAIDAHTWLRNYPVPSAEAVDTLYRQVDVYNGETLPPIVMEGLNTVYTKQAAQEKRIAAIDPTAARQDVIRKAEALQKQTVPETAQPVMKLESRTSGTSLANTPSTELELQDLLRQPDKRGRWGVNLNDDELFGELDALLGKAESGSARLKNSKSGMTSSEAAQRAHELGFIDSPDVDSLKSALDESIFGGRPVYSKLKSPPEFSFEGLEPGQASAPATFQGARELLTRYGEKIGILRKAVDKTGSPLAADELRDVSAKYAALQEGIDAAIDSNELKPQAREALRTANAAYKVQATHKELTDFLQGAMRTPNGGAEEFNPGKILTELRSPKNASLVQKLEDTGIYQGLEKKLQEWQQRFAAPGEKIQQAQELQRTVRDLVRTLDPEERTRLLQYSDAEASMRDRLATAKEEVGAELEQNRMQTEAATGRKQTEIEKEKLQVEREGGISKGKQELLRQQQAAIPNPAFHLFLITQTPFASMIARGLMTEKGQNWVGRVMEATGGMNTAPAFVALYRGLKPTGVIQSTQDIIEGVGKEKR